MKKYQKLSLLEDLKRENLKNKKVLVRVDFNVPLDNELKITDDTRIIGTLETINYLLDNHCIVILISHLGRPKGKITESLRMDPVAKHLENLLGRKVIKLDDCIGSQVQKKINELKYGEIVLLENLRFHKEEKNNDPIFAKQLSSLADIFVNDAFGTAHRAHASTTGVAAHLPSYAGFLIAREVKVYDKLLSHPERPFISIIGGAKVSDKIEVLERLLELCDLIIIGGGMAYTFLAAQGLEIGQSICDDEYIKYVDKFNEKAKELNTGIILPIDLIVTKEFKENTKSYNVKVDRIEKDMIGMDIGEKTIELFKNKLAKAKTVFWNGPLGVFEMDKFARGTNEIANMIASMNGKIFSVVGGGDSIAAIKKFGLMENISHISTGGGASLEYLSGKKLPGLEVLKR